MGLSERGMTQARSTGQLPLELSPKSSARREDLAESQSNAMAVALIDAWPDWPGNVTILAGPVGSGKSHIAEAWLANAGGLKCLSSRLEHEMEALQARVAEGANLVIEDVASASFDETAMFHVFNAVKQAGAYCLITSRTWPQEWGVKLPDLVSRLRAAQVVELQEPDDELLKQVMVKLFADRQLEIDPKVVDYCVLRMERSLESAARLVAAMDAEAMARKAPLSRATAAAALAALGMN